MSKADRKSPKRSKASESRFSIFEMERQFPDDDACLEWLVNERFPEGLFCPKCERITKHHREQARPSYSCQFCGHRVHPMAGTIFENSATSLRLWFYAIYLMSETRCGISAKQIERELGVTYKTAWRMFKQIRSVLVQDDGPLSGTVEIDEAFIGGKAKWKHGKRPKGMRGGSVGKTPVHGYAQRKTDDAPARVMANVLSDTTGDTLLPAVAAHVLPATTVYTDEWRPYGHLGRMGYRHSRVRHEQKVYVEGDVHTNTIEGFWSLLKRGLVGVYHGVSTKHLQSYVDEYVFRYNNREDPRGMFSAFLSRVVRASASPSLPS